jgi:hypothetical protein
MEPTEITLRGLIDLGLEQHREVIEETSKRVDKQYTLDKKLTEMIEGLKNVEIATVPYKNTFILGSIDETL